MIAIDWATPDAYDALARFHYRAGRPATIATRPGGGKAVVAAHHGQALVGVLVVSMPTINAAWRRLAWPGDFDSPDHRSVAAALNQQIRCISRVVVEPRWRGRGVAVDLVRWYLERALTVRTEAVAALGRYCPFFERAGMTPYPMPPSHRDTRLLDALDSINLGPLDLLVPSRIEHALQEHPWIVRELRRWAAGCRSTRTKARGMEPAGLASLAGGVVAAPLTAYAFTRSHTRALRSA